MFLSIKVTRSMKFDVALTPNVVTHLYSSFFNSILPFHGVTFDSPARIPFSNPRRYPSLSEATNSPIATSLQTHGSLTPHSGGGT